MSDKAPEVRASAADALGRIYDYNNMASLLKAMDDEDLAVRRRAFEAVSRIFARRHVFDIHSPSPKRKIIIEVIAADWKVHSTNVGEYHDLHRKPPNQERGTP